MKELREYARDISLYSGTLYGFADVSSLEVLKHYDKYAADALKHIQDNINAIQAYRKALFEHVQKLQTAPKKMTVECRRSVRDNYGRQNEIYYYVHVYNTIEGIKDTQCVISETYSGKDWRIALKRFAELKKQYPKADVKDYSKNRY